MNVPNLIRVANTPRRAAVLARAALLACLLVSGQTPFVLAQQEGSEANRLREQIAALETVERDPAATPEVKLANRRFLSERRARLRGVLQKQVEGWRRYLAVVGPQLSAQERQSSARGGGWLIPG